MANNQSNAVNSVIDILNKELEELVSATGLGSKLKVCFVPQENSPLDGEVKDNTIWIYCHSKEKAIRTLRHEFVDWLIVEAIRPYEQLTNLQRAAINAIFRHVQEQAYSQKEEVVEALLKLIRTDTGGRN